MDKIATEINRALLLLDLDVAAGATARSAVFWVAEGTKACSLELRVTLQGAQPVNLAFRVLGQNSPPAADPTRLLAIDARVPDTSALAVDYAGVFIVSMFTPYAQIEVQNVSGGPVHVKVYAQGCDADFANAAASSAAALAQLAAGAADVGTVHLGAGTAAIGKVDVAVYAPFIDTVASANTTANAYGTSQVVKAPVFVRAARTMTGTVTIGDGTRTGMTLSAGDAMPVHVTNLNQITYTFSVNAATEKFSLSAGI